MSDHVELRRVWGQTAGEYYSSGAYHGSWDIGTPIGTPLSSPVDGTIGDTNDGVPNNPPGTNPGSGAPSNWVLIHYTDPRFGRCTYYLQHLDSGLSVRPGDSVKRGDPIGRTGNSGNSSGPHLHVTLSRSWTDAGTRYAYLSNGSAIYPPDYLDPYPEPDLPEEDQMLVITQGSRARLISGGLVVKVDDADRFGDAGIPKVGVTVDDMDRITSAPTRSLITGVPESVSAAGTAARAAPAIAVGVLLGIVIARAARGG